MNTAVWSRVLAVARITWREIHDDRVPIVAAGVAFWVALAVFPGIALLIWSASHAVGSDGAKALVGTVSDLLPSASRSVIETAVRSALDDNPADGGGEAPWFGAFAPAIGVAATLWSTNSGMKALFVALNVVYDTEQGRGYVRFTLVTLMFTLGSLALVVAVAAVLFLIPIAMSRIGIGAVAATAVRWFRWPLAVAGIALVLALLYRFAPPRARGAWPLVTIGSTLAALLLIAGTALFSVVASRFVASSVTYGPLSTVAAFLLWLWFNALVVLACAEIDATVERQTSNDKRRAATGDTSTSSAK